MSDSPAAASARFVARYSGAALMVALLTSAAVAASASPWSEALARGDLKTLAELASPAVDINQQDAKGRTVLMLSAARGDQALLARVLALRASVDQRNHAGGTALMYTAQYGHLAAARALLDAGASVNLIAAKGWSALMIAVLKGHQLLIDLLLARGADPNLADMHGWTPLMRALDADRTAIARTLISSAQTHLAAAATSGETALHIAAMRGHLEAISLLLDGGVDPAVTDAAGHTPLVLAERAGRTRAVQLLRAASAPN